MKKCTILNGFWLRIIALVTMTVDHIGVLFDFSKFYWMRIIGRISLPLFVFLSVQGALHTRDKKRYAIRLSILLVITSIALLFLSLMPGALKEIAYTSGNIFFDLLLSVFCVWILDSKNSKIKPLIALPISYSVFSYVVVKLEGCGCNGLYTWFPPSIRMQYSFFAILLSICFYYSNKLSYYYKNELDEDDNSKQQFMANVFSAISLVLVCGVMLGISFVFGEKYYTVIDSIETYAIISGVFILLYNGKRGYNAKWFRILSYSYYPLHILIIGLCCLS